ncbi:MAG: hypothetical protein INQ03_20960 [Candidatus Heimdallarchaeota archaeon]|nr:hypothetical protein [Candidatus Heimdallarchaeota archaeon]
MEELRADELREVLGFINNIKSYELTTQRKIDDSISLVWGLVLLFAGFGDLLLKLSGEEFLASLMWFGAVFVGMTYSTLTLKYFGRDYVTEEGKTSFKESKLMLESTFKIMLVVTLIGTVILINLVIINIDFMTPFLIFLIGSVFLFLDLKNRKNGEHEDEIPGYFIWSIPYFTSILCIALYYIISPEVVVYFGLIMGISLGTINFISFFVNMKSDQKIDELE